MLVYTFYGVAMMAPSAPPAYESCCACMGFGVGLMHQSCYWPPVITACCLSHHKSREDNSDVRMWA